MRKRFALAATMLALTFVSTSCASTSSAGETADAGPTFDVQIEVENAVSGLAPLSIYIQRQSSGRKLLGTVNSGQKRTFNYTASSGVYTLSAPRSAGQETFTSEQIQLNGSEKIFWRLPANTVTRGQ